MRIVVTIKEIKRKTQFDKSVKMTMRLDQSPDDRVATYNTGIKVFEKLKQSFIDNGGGVNDDGTVYLCK